MSLKSSLLALAENIGMCQENARSIKQALAGGLTAVGAAANVINSDKLWVNEAPSSAYADTPITITDGDQYDGFYVMLRPQANMPGYVFYYDAAAINDDVNYSAHYTYISSGKVYELYRNIKFTQAEGSHNVVLNVGKGRTFHIDPYGTGVSASDNNNGLVPLCVIGVKY